MTFAWQPIEQIVAGSANDERTIIVTDGVCTTALAFCEGGDWYLGEADQVYREMLDFEPEFWVERDIPTNPFRLAFPDGRPSLLDLYHARRAPEAPSLSHKGEVAAGPVISEQRGEGE